MIVDESEGTAVPPCPACQKIMMAAVGVLRTRTLLENVAMKAELVQLRARDFVSPSTADALRQLEKFLVDNDPLAPLNVRLPAPLAAIAMMKRLQSEGRLLKTARANALSYAEAAKTERRAWDEIGNMVHALQVMYHDPQVTVAGVDVQFEKIYRRVAAGAREKDPEPWLDPAFIKMREEYNNRGAAEDSGDVFSNPDGVPGYFNCFYCGEERTFDDGDPVPCECESIRIPLGDVVLLRRDLAAAHARTKEGIEKSKKECRGDTDRRADVLGAYWFAVRSIDLVIGAAKNVEVPLCML